MASDGNGTAWSETVPANTEYVKDGALEVREVKKALRIRLEKEHVALGDSSAGGEHKAGSAVAYYQSSAPTNRPDAATALTAADNGRLFVDSDDKKLYVYVHGTGFTLVAADVPAASIATADLIDKSVTTAKLDDGAVNDVKLGASAVYASHIASDAVTTAKILNANVTEAKLAAAVTAQFLKGTNFAVLEDQKTSGTDGQTLTSGDWRTRDLNTEVVDTGAITGITSNAFALAAGTYLIFAYCPFRGSSGNVAQSRVHNTSDDTVAITGTTVSSPASANTTCASICLGIVTIAATKTFEVQMQSSANVNTGGAGSYGTEVYTQVLIIRLS